MAAKVSMDFILGQYGSAAEHYKAYALEVGLWQSEKYVFEKYVHLNHTILDLGCGAGRTTFSLYELGYSNITGVDITPEMIQAAQEIQSVNKLPIKFQVGDATRLKFDDSNYDVVFFSFNGMMSIPSKSIRTMALKEVSRILKPGGIYIFTTHDRNKEPHYFKFWKEEKERWNKGLQNAQLYEFGDIIGPSKNEVRDIYLHIPNQNEVAEWLEVNGFKVLETFYRNELFDESDQVKEKSGECRFWIARKGSMNQG